ncbi:MAG: double-cubane-cluster-containing anaerobic reductase [Thermoanaerobaculales bacterium]|jgi:benzoyl-CoA reductase/2-hydroxyglutaryl-CoA dehydratase subunit BcrC/BadD/HgdB|nr:double-cubane-cluster-containing anaerobic reductase [Thermoanaerobaculales bacterium]
MTNAPDYRPMWTELGLDLDNHDALLNALGQLYTDTYLSQANRPEGMGYFDFVMGEVHGLRIKELVDARAQGKIVVGAFCVFVPEELVLAANGICVGLCAGADFGTEEAERYLPRNTCSLIKSFFGFALEKVCPYLQASDLVVGENTCDGKKKAYEIFQGMIPGEFMALDMPNTKSAEGRAVLKKAYIELIEKLEKLSGTTITVEALKDAIGVVNAKRRALHRLAALRQAVPAPISGLDALLANQVAFYDDPQRFTSSVEALCDELDRRVEQGEGVVPASTPRIVMSGCPMAVPNWKLPAIVEASGAIIVGEESCIGDRGQQNLVSGDGDTIDALIDNLVDRYFTIDCAVFTPNPGRAEHASAMADGAKADGVIHYALQFCSPYQIEAPTLEAAVERGGTPVLRIDTDYSAEDVEQLRTRVEAFVEQIGG